MTFSFPGCWMQPSSSFFFSHLNWNLIGFICPSSRAVEVWKRFTQIQNFDFLFQIIISKGLKEFECDLFYPRLFLRQGWKTAFDFQVKGRRAGHASPCARYVLCFYFFHLITFLVSVWFFHMSIATLKLPLPHVLHFISLRGKVKKTFQNSSSI